MQNREQEWHRQTVFLLLLSVRKYAAKPHQCVDATVMAADFVMNIQTIVARELDPIEGAVVTVGSLKSGTQYNIISGKAVLEGTCRSYSEI